MSKEMKKINNNSNSTIEVKFIKHFNKENDLVERDYYYIYDKTTSTKVGEVFVYVSNDSIYIGDLDMYDYTLDKSFYNQGYGTKFINLLKTQFKTIKGLSVPEAIGFWKKCGAILNTNNEFIIK